MQINPESTVPIYQQIVAELRGAIAAGVYRPGEWLPSQREVALKLGVNPNTVQRAFEHLEREGLVESHRGQGLTVANKGDHSARRGSQTEVRRAMKEAVGVGVRAGIDEAGLRELFELALRDANGVPRRRRKERRVQTGR